MKKFRKSVLASLVAVAITPPYMYGATIYYTISEGRESTINERPENVSDITIARTEFPGKETSIQIDSDIVHMATSSGGISLPTSFLTLINSSRIGALTIDGESSDQQRNYFIENSKINELAILGERISVSIDANSVITEIHSQENAHSSVANNGEIASVTDVEKVINGGTIADIRGAQNIHNMRGGMLIKSSEEGVIVGNLVNDGTILLQAQGTLYYESPGMKTDSVKNTGTITATGESVLGILGNTEFLNAGIIKEEYRTTESAYSFVLMGSTGSKTTLTNTGTMEVPENGIAVWNFDSRVTDGTVEVNNTGSIIGGIYNLVTEDKARIVVNNEETGRWYSKFDNKMLRTELGSPIYLKIKNDGTVGTIKRPDGQAGEMMTNEFSNNGTIDIRNAPLVINGQYKGGVRGRLLTSGTLGGDETELPTLTINGGVTGETTHVKVVNIGGAGAATTDGILVVRADTVAGGGFSKEGRIVAGAYDYDLVRVESGDHTEWRLTSSLTPEPPGPVPPGPEPGPEPVPPAPVHIVRPEAVTYAENLRQANTLFMTDSEQRRAVGEYTDPVTGRTETSSLWLSQTGGHSARHDASGQLNSDYNRYTVQLGGTLLSLPAGDDGRLEAGVQAGYGHARGNTRSGLTGYRARGTVSGYSTGLYGTWRQHRDGQSGAYISTTLQYSWLKNQVKGDDLAAEKYDARGTRLSLEGGYDYAVWQGGEQNGDSLFIRPHAQVTRMGVKADEHREANGTRVRQQGDGSVFSRTGVRVWLDKAVSKGQRVQPFVETNWLHNTRDFCSSMDGVRDCLAGNRNQAEVLAGVTGDVSRNVAVTAQAGGRFGSQASRDLAGTLNVSVKF
ncbi:autotransporter outer membrane beta-barrel domain-containing protein [Salmonella enterica]